MRFTNKITTRFLLIIILPCNQLSTVTYSPSKKCHRAGAIYLGWRARFSHEYEVERRKFTMAQCLLTLLEVLNPQSFIHVFIEPFVVVNNKTCFFLQLHNIIMNLTLYNTVLVHKINHALFEYKITVQRTKTAKMNFVRKQKYRA